MDEAERRIAAYLSAIFKQRTGTTLSDEEAHAMARDIKQVYISIFVDPIKAKLDAAKIDYSPAALRERFANYVREE